MTFLNFIRELGHITVERMKFVLSLFFLLTNGCRTLKECLSRINVMEKNYKISIALRGPPLFVEDIKYLPYDDPTDYLETFQDFINFYLM